jgi:hypothetical protein
MEIEKQNMAVRYPIDFLDCQHSGRTPGWRLNFNRQRNKINQRGEHEQV